MLRLKYFLISAPFLLLLILFRGHFFRIGPTLKSKVISPQIVGKWVVGKHSKFNDADTLELQVAIDNSLSGDTILLRPGKYKLKNIPSKNLIIRGLSGEAKDIEIELVDEISIIKSKTRFENIYLLSKKTTDVAFIVDSSDIIFDNTKVKFPGAKKILHLKNNSSLKSLNNHFIGSSKNTAIYLGDKSTLDADNNKFIKFKNAIETEHGNFNGMVELQNIEASNCTSSAFYIYGGHFRGVNLNISKSASGAIFLGGVNAQLENISISDNKFFAIDALDGAQVKIDLFNFDNNIKAGIHSSGNKSNLRAVNGKISNSETAIIAENGANVTGKQINFFPAEMKPAKYSTDSLVNLIY